VKQIDNPNEYHAPELCEIMVKEHIEVHSSVDVWAVGIIMYFALIGKYPWQKAAVDVKPYFEWEQWMKKKTTIMPPKWGRFTEKGLKLFRKTLKPRADDRASVKELRKYIGSDKWMRVDMNKVSTTHRRQSAPKLNKA
jgi:serine/threonine protein kinase